MASVEDRLYLDLKGARERLCRASTGLPERHALALSGAVETIDRVAAFHCPQWSRFDMPELPPLQDPDGGRRGD
jgi:hypothetical protein